MTSTANLFEETNAAHLFRSIIIVPDSERAYMN
jgi:hypothetical protein